MDELRAVSNAHISYIYGICVSSEAVLLLDSQGQSFSMCVPDYVPYGN